MRVKINVNLEAKNCPFCGKPPIFYFATSGFGMKVYIQCPDGCAAKDEEIKHDSHGYYKNIENACEKLIKEWNTRVKE